MMGAGRSGMQTTGGVTVGALAATKHEQDELDLQAVTVAEYLRFVEKTILYKEDLWARKLIWVSVNLFAALCFFLIIFLGFNQIWSFTSLILPGSIEMVVPKVNITEASSAISASILFVCAVIAAAFVQFRALLIERKKASIATLLVTERVKSFENRLRTSILEAQDSLALDGKVSDQETNITLMKASAAFQIAERAIAEALPLLNETVDGSIGERRSDFMLVLPRERESIEAYRDLSNALQSLSKLKLVIPTKTGRPLAA